LIEGNFNRFYPYIIYSIFIDFPAHDLCPFDEGGFHDPYVRLTLDPEVDQRKRQTAIYRAETHPYFDQHFKFPISRDQLPGKQLILQVCCLTYRWESAPIIPISLTGPGLRQILSQ
jgi:hypothetical protein